jgi:hypothetical protein
MKTLLLEHETCGRCGGTGHFSYNQMSGTTCFGCGGRKVRLTKRGAAAQAALNNRLMISPLYLTPGQQFVFDDHFVGQVKRLTRTVAAVEITVSAWHVMADGQQIPIQMVRVTTTKGEDYGFAVNLTLKRPATQADHAWALAYQATLTKSGKPMKAARIAA